MRLVILGGAFCGAAVARLLDTNKVFEITLIDKTPYYKWRKSPRLMAISLGDYHRILTSSNFTILGFLAGIIKQLAHRWIIRQYR